MKSDDRHNSPEAVLEQLIQLLNGEQLGHSIDAPIERAAVAFEAETPQLSSVGDMLGHLIRFTQAGADAVAPGYRLPEPQAREQVLRLLDQHYGSASATGHEAAFLAAMEFGEDALPDILEALKIGLKSDLRSKHVRWAYGRLVASRPWKERCAISAACRNLLGHFLPDSLLELPPHRLEPVLFDVLTAYATCVSTLSQTASHRWPAETEISAPFLPLC